MKRIQKRLHGWLVATPVIMVGLLGAQLFLTPVMTQAAPICGPSDSSGCDSSNCSSSGGSWENPFPGTAHPSTCVFTCSAAQPEGCSSESCSANGGMWGNPYPGSAHPDSCVFGGSTNTTGSTSSQGGPDKQDAGLPNVTDEAAAGGNCKNVEHCDLFIKYINPAINLLAAAVGIIVAISIIIGGLQYGSSAGDPQKASAARNRIRNAIIALVTFLFLYAMLNFLIPGGLLNI